MRIAALACLALLAAGCGGQGRPSTTGRAGPPPRLTGPHPCPGTPGFTCAMLTVPLDHGGQASGTLRLPVGYETARAAPRGVLLFLTGGPGQPGVSFLRRVDTTLRAALTGYRLVMFDQRGTGAGALECPALQAAAGASDTAPVPAGTVAACARTIGVDRRYYSTPETVADIDELRAALGARRLTVDGVSYGTFTAERYALTYPNRVARLVLDSVVPDAGVDPLDLASIQATARVLRAACAAQRCRSDPANDAAALVRSGRVSGPLLLNALTLESVAFPAFLGIPEALHAARTGHLSALDGFFAGVKQGEAAPAPALSQGLHESTLCLDLAPGWDPRSQPSSRAAALARGAARLPQSAFFPFNRATATGNGMARGCLEWPATDPPGPAVTSTRLPSVPVLLLAGGHDLSTPLAWAREEAARAPDGRLVVVPAAGHSVQLRAANAGARRILARFLQARGS